MNYKIESVISSLPQKAGVYRYYDQNDILLYVGKAKNLKKRVSSYFSKNNHSDRISVMVSQIFRVEYTIVTTETEALILEADIIKNLQPKYNVLLRQGKDYFYIYIDRKSSITNLKILKNIATANKREVFGPYDSLHKTQNIVNSLRSVVPFCSNNKVSNKPCSYYHIKQCDGVCCGKETIEEYNIKIELIKSILSGRTLPAELYIKDKIQRHIHESNFQLAHINKQRLIAINSIKNDQKIILSSEEDLDIITMSVYKNVSEVVCSFFVQNICAGKVINNYNLILSGWENKLENDFIESAWLQFFSNYHSMTPSKNIIMNTFFTK